LVQETHHLSLREGWTVAAMSGEGFSKSRKGIVPRVGAERLPYRANQKVNACTDEAKKKRFNDASNALRCSKRRGDEEDVLAVTLERACAYAAIDPSYVVPEALMCAEAAVTENVSQGEADIHNAVSTAFANMRTGNAEAFARAAANACGDQRTAKDADEEDAYEAANSADDAAEEERLAAARAEEEAVNTGLEEAKPAEEALDVWLEEAKPAEEAVNAVPEEAKPAEQAVNVGLEEAKPAEEAFNTGLQEAKPVEEAANVEEAKPAEEAVNVVFEEATPAEEAVNVALEEAKPAEEAQTDDEKDDNESGSNRSGIGEEGDDETSSSSEMEEDLSLAKSAPPVSKCIADDRAKDTAADDMSEVEPPPKRLRLDVGDNLGVHMIYDDFKRYKIYLQEGKYNQGLLIAKIAKLLHRVIINVRTCTRMLQTDLSDEERHRWDICFLQNTTILKIMSSYIADRRM